MGQDGPYRKLEPGASRCSFFPFDVIFIKDHSNSSGVCLYFTSSGRLPPPRNSTGSNYSHDGRRSAADQPQTVGATSIYPGGRGAGTAVRIWQWRSGWLVEKLGIALTGYRPIFGVHRRYRPQETVAIRRGFQWQASHKLGLQVAHTRAKRHALNPRGRIDKRLS